MHGKFGRAVRGHNGSIAQNVASYTLLRLYDTLLNPVVGSQVAELANSFLTPGGAALSVRVQLTAF